MSVTTVDKEVEVNGLMDELVRVFTDFQSRQMDLCTITDAGIGALLKINYLQVHNMDTVVDHIAHHMQEMAEVVVAVTDLDRPDVGRMH